MEFETSASEDKEVGRVPCDLRTQTSTNAGRTDDKKRSRDALPPHNDHPEALYNHVPMMTAKTAVWTTV